VELTKGQALGFVRARADLFDKDPNPFGKAAWLLHFIEHIVGHQHRVVAPQHRSSVMLLHKVGQKARPLANYYTGLWGPRAASVDDLQAMTYRLPYPSINFAPMSAEEASTLQLERALWANQWYVRRYVATANWYCPTEGLTWQQYLAGRPKLQKNLKQKGKAFAGKLSIVTEPDDLLWAMDNFEWVYSHSWQGKAQPESHPEFVRAWAQTCAENGWLRLGFAALDGRTIATGFWFVIDRKAYIFKICYDQAYGKTYAGGLVTALLMQHVLDVDKVTEVDYLTGDDPYKKEWMTHRRERFGLAACNLRTMRGLGRAVIEHAGQLSRKWRQ
jgi:hypothetical protein